MADRPQLRGPSSASSLAAARSDPRHPDSERFAWCSLDPVSQELVPYVRRHACALEAAYRAGHAELPLLLHCAGMDGLIAFVRFNDPSVGNHTQRTASGVGELKVIRVGEDDTIADFGDGLRVGVPVSAFVCFGRVAWVTVDPLSGELQPYSREHALLCEQAFRSKESGVQFDVHLPANVLHVHVELAHESGQFFQRTNKRGLRSVLRVARDAVPPEGEAIPLYRRPADGTIDSQRYRLEPEDASGLELAQVGAVNIPESVFMAETQLTAEAFSPLSAFETAMREMGYVGVELDAIADALKEEAMRLAAEVATRAYKDNPDVQLVGVIREILEEWGRSGLFGEVATSGEGIEESLAEQASDLLLIVRNLFISWDTNEESITELVAQPTRRGGSIIQVRKVAAAALWRIIMVSGT